MARTLAVALSMPAAERRMRYDAMMKKLRQQTIQQWFADFLEALQDGKSSKVADEPVVTGATSLWPRRAGNSAARYH
jgi:trehalose 6-phosphate synthase